MNKKRVVITGVGVVAPNGIGKNAFWQSLADGRSGIKPITLFDTSFFKPKTAGECSDFNAEEFLGTKGLRNLDRSTKLVLSAAKLAIEDAKLKITEENSDDIGVVTATTLSVIANIFEFSKEAHDEGPQFVNPAMFPRTTINSPSSQISIKFNIKGFNTTISTGFSASLDSLKYAADFIKLGRAKAVLVAGVEAIFFQTFLGFNKIDFLAGIKGKEISCPFDRRRNGIILGEGSAALLLEDEKSALKRNARIYAQVSAVENYFDPFRSSIGRYSPYSVGLKRSMSQALKNANLKTNEIDYICAAANSVPSQDRLETAAIKEVFGLLAKDIPVSSIKSMIGETVSAAGILQIASVLGAMENNFIPPTINYKEPDPVCDLDYVPNKKREKTIKNVLVNNFGPGGNNAAAVIKKYS